MSAIPKKWTPAKVRVNAAGKVQISIPAPKRNPARRTAKNESVAMGFWRGGVFHPIRASDDYDPEAVGETRQYAKTKKKKAKAKRRKK